MGKKLSEQDKVKMCLNCPKELCDDCLSRRGVNRRNTRSPSELIKIARMYASGIPVQQIEQELGVSHGSIYYLINKGKQEIAMSKGV